MAELENGYYWAIPNDTIYDGTIYESSPRIVYIADSDVYCVGNEVPDSIKDYKSFKGPLVYV